MTTFVEQAGRFAATAEKIARIQGAVDEADLLERAQARLVETGYDNLDGGTTLYTFMLELPIPQYASIESQRDDLENAVLARVRQFTRVEGGNAITQVVISPVLTEEVRPSPPLTLSDPEGTSPEGIPSFWQPGYFRLFVSHLASNKKTAHDLKQALASYQIAAFVAHDDIVPTREWQDEIESALRTMDGLAAVVEPAFVNSGWCDQEVGYALGRGKLVIPIRAGADPHGFMGKYQGIQARDLTPAALAKLVFEALVAHTQSGSRMIEAIVERTVASTSYADAQRNIALLEQVPSLNQLQVTRLIQASEQNSQLRDAWNVRDKIRALVARVGTAS